MNYNFSLQETREAIFAEKVLDYTNGAKDTIFYTSTYNTSRKIGLFDTKNYSDMIFDVHDLNKPTIEDLLEENRYYMVSEKEQYIAGWLSEALEEQGYTVKMELVDSISYEEYKVLIYCFLEEE